LQNLQLVNFNFLTVATFTLQLWQSLQLS